MFESGLHDILSCLLSEFTLVPDKKESKHRKRTGIEDDNIVPDSVLISTIVISYTVGMTVAYTTAQTNILGRHVTKIQDGSRHCLVEVETKFMKVTQYTEDLTLKVIKTLLY